MEKVLRFILSVMLFTAPIFPISAQTLREGMTVLEIRQTLGQPKSQLERSGRILMTFEGGRSLEFIDGKLVDATGYTLTTNASNEVTEASSTQVTVDRSINKDPVPEDSTILDLNALDTVKPTIVESEEEFVDYDGGIMEDFQEALDEYEAAREESLAAYEPEEPSHLFILIGFFVELFITFVVLKITYHIYGFPALNRQLFALALILAAFGTLMEVTIHASRFNPVRVGLTFFLLLFTIRQMTDVREWATAIRIAIIARLVSIVAMWLFFAGKMIMFGLTN